MSDASVSVIDGRAVVRVGGSELLDPKVAAAERARDAVRPTYGIGAPAANAGIDGSFYRDMTDPLSPLEYFKTTAGWQGPRSLRGNPGGNVMAIGLFKEAASLIIPNGTDAVRTKGHTLTGLGIADYTYDPGVDAAYVAAHPRSSFVSANGRGFKLVLDGCDVKMFGAIGRGASDDSLAVQECYDLLAATRHFGELRFPEGLYNVSFVAHSRGIDILGGPRGSTVLQPASVGGTVLRLAMRDGNWSTATIRDLSFKGTSDLLGVGVEWGDAANIQANDHLTVSISFVNVEFVDLDKCVSRPSGNIGATFTDCTFSRANFHLYSVASPDKMHPGCLEVRGGHMQGAEKALCYIDGKEMTGSGQVIFDGVVMEANAGHVFYIENFRGSEAVPGIVVRSCWNEVNAEQSRPESLKAGVTIDGKTTPPVYAHLKNVTHFRLEDTPPGTIRAINSAGLLIDCALDHYSPQIDSNSAMPIVRGRSFTSIVPAKVESLAGLPAGSQFAPWWWMPHPTHTTLADRAYVLIARDCASPFLLFGTAANQDTATRPNDAVLPGVTSSQIATIPAGESVFPPAAQTTAGKWLAWSVTCKLLSGGAPKMLITGSEAITGEQVVDHAGWKTYRGTRDNERALAESVRFVAGASGCQIALGGLALMQFDTRQDALDWVNSGCFPN